MRTIRAGAAALCLAAATAACSGSGNDTGSSGGWRVSAAHIRIPGAATACRTPSPALDTFSSTPSPNPNCSPSAAGIGQATPSPQDSAAPEQWQNVHVEEQYHGGSAQQWHSIYTTYTAPPGTGVYQAMVHATNQPMPTPPVTASSTPTPLMTPSALPTQPPFATTPPTLVQPSATP